MSSIGSPAVARHRVRLALRSAREAKQLTQSDIAQEMEWSLSKVMRIEKGEVNVSPNDLRTLLNFLDVSEPQQVQRLLDDARLSRQERWTTDPADREFLTPAMIELQQFEAEATTIRYYQNFIIPGVLQTRAYAEALFDGAGEISDRETIAARIDARQRRHREVLYRPNPPRCLVVLDESVLLRPIGGATVMADQLEDLRRVVGETRLEVRILAFNSTVSSRLFYSPFYLCDLEDTQSVFLYREIGASDVSNHSQDEVDRHREVFDQMWTGALDDVASSARLAAAIVDLRTGKT